MNLQAAIEPERGDALVIVDVQNDFLPGGNLAVPEGDAVIPPLNEFIQRFQDRGRPVYATRDWHPPDHCSFKPQGGPWPPHCVAETEGAAFAADLHLPADAVVIYKGTLQGKDAYSGFDGTNLAGHLRDHDISRLFVGGLTTEYCVLNTVKDALAEGFKVMLTKQAVRAVEADAGDGDRAIAEMQRCGAELI